jgi:glycolate oxidase FAD binding subunit
VISGISPRQGLVPQLEQLLEPESVLVSDLERYSVDGVLPTAVARPGSVEQISAILRIANEQNWIVVPFGGGTRQQVGQTPERIDIVLSTERLDKIESYDPGDLTIAVEGGARVDSVSTACAQHRQQFALEAPSGATVGGALAANESGPLRAGFGAPRDFCIGVNFVTGDGVNGRGGGRVVKNVAGYDLMKLMIGSFGTLGVIVSANFKLFPLAQQTATFISEFDSVAEAIQARDWLLRSPLSPIAAELISPTASEYLTNRAPRDPDSWAPEAASQQKKHWTMALRFAGSDRVLARCRKELAFASPRDLSALEETVFWRAVASFEATAIARHRNGMIFHVSAPLAESQNVIEAAQGAATDYNFVASTIGRLTVGTFVVAFLPLAIDPPGATQFASAASHFRSRLSRAASAVVMRCPLEAKPQFDLWGSTPSDRLLMQKIKRAFDPNNILNRGRFLVE